MSDKKKPTCASEWFAEEVSVSFTRADWSYICDILRDYTEKDVSEIIKEMNEIRENDVSDWFKRNREFTLTLLAKIRIANEGK